MCQKRENTEASANRSTAMEQIPFQKRVSPRNQRSRGNLLMVSAICILFSSYCFGQQVNVQQNQQNVNINLPVIEKTVYVDRYRTVYVDRPQPQRVAKKLSAPIQLLGYLWIYPEDLGEFKQHPINIIANINARNTYGRNNWRIPTPDELAVLENNADKVGLGDDIYLAADHTNGVLRLVATEAANEIPEEKAERLGGIFLQGLIWSKKNVGAAKSSDYGKHFYNEEGLTACPKGWRLPTKDEFNDLINSGDIYKLNLPFSSLYIESYYTQSLGVSYGKVLKLFLLRISSDLFELSTHPYSGACRCVTEP